MEKKSGPTSRKGKHNQPLGCFVPNDANGRHCSFPQCFPEVHVKTTEHTRVERGVQRQHMVRRG